MKNKRNNNIFTISKEKNIKRLQLKQTGKKRNKWRKSIQKGAIQCGVWYA